MNVLLLFENGRLYQERSGYYDYIKAVEPFIDKNTLYRITYVLKDVEKYGLDKDYCILAIKKLEIKEMQKMNKDYLKDVLIELENIYVELKSNKDKRMIKKLIIKIKELENE